MPKRNSKEKIDYYRMKIRKLENKHRRIRPIISSSESEDDTSRADLSMETASIDPDPDIPVTDPPTNLPGNTNNTTDPAVLQSNEPVTIDASASQPEAVELEPDILAALGEANDEIPEYGEKIHESLAKIWLPILKKGLIKESRESFLKTYLIPDNCVLLQAPTLNPEIQAAIPESGKFRDKKMAISQQQLGAGITAVNRGLNLLISNENKMEAIKFICDGCRILSDLHHQQTETRKKFITPCLDKTFLQVVDQSERDNTLFGNNLSDKIKASKVITKQGQQIKKTSSTPKPSSSHVHTAHTTRSSFQGNWQTPSRFQSNRGGRGGYKRNIQRPTPSSQPKMTSSSKYRAPKRQ